MKKKYYKGLSLILVSAMVMAGVAGCASVGAAEDAKDEAEEAVTDAVTQAVQTQKTPSDKESFKEETVYVITDNNGKVDKTIVEEWLKNPKGKDVIEDKSNLKEIKNVKGEETFSEDKSMSLGTHKFQGNNEKIHLVLLKKNFCKYPGQIITITQRHL